jgi:CheY-like chemotaxis protein
MMHKEVLLVEDSPGDVRLTREAFREADKSIHLSVASDGVEAMAFLRQEGQHVDAPRPDLILLDLNLPKMDGREVLAQIKKDDSLKMRCRPACGWNLRGAISGNLKLSDQAARSIG